MMMERLRWLVAVLVAFVAGWVGHAVYGERPEPAPSSVSAAPTERTPSVAAAPEAAEPGVDRVDPATTPPTPEPVATSDAQEETPAPDQAMRTPAAVAVVTREMERANLRWFEDFRAEPLDAAWAATTEASIRRDLIQHRPWGSADLESLECRSRNCYMVLILRAPTAGDSVSTRTPDDAFAGFATRVGEPTRVEGDPRATRMEVFITRLVVTPGG